MKTRLPLLVALLLTTVAGTTPASAPDTPAARELERRLGPGARLVAHPVTGMTRFAVLPPDAIRLAGSDAVERAADFLDRHGAAFGVTDPGRQLAPPRQTTDRFGFTHLTYSQRHHGVPVFGAVLQVHFDPSGRLTVVNGTLLPDLTVDVTPRIDLSRAIRAAEADLERRLKHLPAGPLKVRGQRLLIYRSGLARRAPGEPRLAFEIEISDGGSVREFLYVDAKDATVIDRISGIHETLQRRVHQTSYPALIWSEGDVLPYSTGDATNDQQVNTLIDTTEATYNLFFHLSGEQFESWDGQSALLENVWKPSWTACPNAFWNGVTTAFCDGVAGDDVVAHEWTHAYTEGTHDLIYQAQPGALNESYSDIFGELIDLINFAGTDSPGPLRAATGCSAFGGTPLPTFTVYLPASLAGTYDVAGAAYNPPGPLSVGAQLELVNDGVNNGGATLFTDACEPLVGFTPGRIALVDRGVCGFGLKTANAQFAGASGVVVINNTSGVATLGGSFPGATIPSVMISQSDGALLRAQPAGSVAATIAYAGANDASYRWLIGEDAFNIGIIRDLWNPTCFSHPGKVSDALYWCASGDNGGVHVNSGIPNHAFALLTDGGTYNGVAVGAIGAIKTLSLYWRAMSVYQVPDTDFADHADALLQSCTDLLGLNLPHPLNGLPSGQIPDANDCAQVAAATQAVEMQGLPACSFAPLLAQSPPPFPCGSAVFFDDLETDPNGRWSFTNAGVFPEYVRRDWEWTSEVPGGGSGSALFADDDPWIGSCIAGFDDQTRQLTAETPEIVLDGNATVAFDHYVATEWRVDGGNLTISVNGGPFQVIPGSSFLYNPYNTTFVPASATYANPLAGQPAFSGTDNAVSTGTWGTSQISLAGIAGPGDSVRLRFEFGTDGCTGVDGWYVDNLLVCTDVATAGRVPNGDDLPGSPLRLGKAPAEEITLSWDASCHVGDTDYEIYAGTLGAFTTHEQLLCSTGGSTTATFGPGAGDLYYLVVPRNGDREGSYGNDSSGTARPAGTDACNVQAVFPGCG